MLLNTSDQFFDHHNCGYSNPCDPLVTVPTFGFYLPAYSHDACVCTALYILSQ